VKKTQLEPCPCCGHKAKVMQSVNCSLHMVMCLNSACGIRTGGERSEHTAIKIWNKRAETINE